MLVTFVPVTKEITMKIPSLFLLVALVLPMTPALVHAQGAPPCRWWSVTLTRHPRCWSPPTYANGTVAASIPDPRPRGGDLLLGHLSFPSFTSFIF